MLRLFKLSAIILVLLGLGFSLSFAAITPLTEYNNAITMTNRSGAAGNQTRSCDSGCNSAGDTWPYVCIPPSIFTGCTSNSGLCVPKQYTCNAQPISINVCPNTGYDCYISKEYWDDAAWHGVSYCSGFMETETDSSDTEALYYVVEDTRHNIINNQEYIDRIKEHIVTSCGSKATIFSYISEKCDIEGVYNFCNLRQDAELELCPDDYSVTQNSLSCIEGYSGVECKVDCGTSNGCLGYYCKDASSNSTSCNNMISDQYYVSLLTEEYPTELYSCSSSSIVCFKNNGRFVFQGVSSDIECFHSLSTCEGKDYHVYESSLSCPGSAVKTCHLSSTVNSTSVNNVYPLAFYCDTPSCSEVIEDDDYLNLIQSAGITECNEGYGSELKSCLNDGSEIKYCTAPIGADLCPSGYQVEKGNLTCTTCQEKEACYVDIGGGVSGLGYYCKISCGQCNEMITDSTYRDKVITAIQNSCNYVSLDSIHIYEDKCLNNDIDYAYCGFFFDSSTNAKCPEEYSISKESNCGTSGDKPMTQCYVESGTPGQGYLGFYCNQCSDLISDSYYLGKLLEISPITCDSAYSTASICQNDTIDITYCEVQSGVQLPKCPENDYGITGYDTGYEITQSQPCYVSIGSKKYLAYMNPQDLETCANVFNEYNSDGYKLIKKEGCNSFDPSQGEDPIRSGVNNGGIPSIGNETVTCWDEAEQSNKTLCFGCKNYNFTPLPIGKTCLDYNAGSHMCAYFAAYNDNEKTTRYECFCPDSYKTEEDCKNEKGEDAVLGGLECSFPMSANIGRGIDPGEPTPLMTPIEYEYCRGKSEMCSNATPDLSEGIHIKQDGDYNISYIYSTFDGTDKVGVTQCYWDSNNLSQLTSVNLYAPGIEIDDDDKMETACREANDDESMTVSSFTVYFGSSATEAPYYGVNPTTATLYRCDIDSSLKSKQQLCLDAGISDICDEIAQVSGKIHHTRPIPKQTRSVSDYGYYPDDEEFAESLACLSTFITKEEYCQLASGGSSGIDYNSCLENAVGQGTPCELDGETKYKEYSIPCPTSGSATVVSSKEDCRLDGEAIYKYSECTEDGVTKYICRCPQSYKATCESPYETPGGKRCDFDLNSLGMVVAKYKSCELTCYTSFAAQASETFYGCPMVGDYTSPIRGGYETPEMCVLSSDANRPLYYICACPSNFKTLEDWCAENYTSQEVTEEQCINTFAGIDEVCQLDIEQDAQGNPIKVLNKYASYVRFCPTDRPLYYSEDDCRIIGGEYEYSCIDNNQNQRVVCRCPSAWYSIDTSCPQTEIDSDLYNAEPAGEYCDFDGVENIKYEQCVIKCTNWLDQKAIPGAYTYLPSDNQTPTQTLCHNMLGNGAVFGVTEQAYCSLNNTLMYPCYCPQDFQECLAENNEIPDPNASMCKVNDKTYYSECTNAACAAPSNEIVILDVMTFPNPPSFTSLFGSSVTYKRCIDQNGDEAWEVKCDSSIYNDPCDYPYEPDLSNSDYCLVGENGANLDASSRPHYKSGQCKVLKNFGVCGETLIGVTGSIIVGVTQTENECTSQFGTGASYQLCEYGPGQGYKRAYNCYYDPSAYIYTTANCGVRHDLTGKYVIKDGIKHWNQCKCTSAYQHHKFNCGGMLLGNPCQEYITPEFISEFELSGYGYSVGEQIPFYPYCECSADYTEICDEDGSGRYKGVGTACNGKYTACECVPDKLPDNWSDNYYGCPGGKKPTGVWKDNGCGQKYYQCQVVECTWEYTEMCQAPLIPVGQSCQDNEGNIGGYKSCTCPSNYSICAAGQVGEGEPCNLKGVSYYKNCKSQEGCTSLASETCTGPLQIGVNPCIRDDITYFESCVCANGYDKVCGEGEVGVGNYCELNGVKHYKECVDPKQNQCTAGHVTACDANQESYYPCTEKDPISGKEVVKYMCRCPTNWKACSGGTGEQCTSKDANGNETTYYEECNSGAPTCSPYQELTYKVCTPAQTGDGGSCTSPATEEGGQDVIKYAVCKDSGNCLTNGFRFSCSGYDPSVLGESCVDDQGNKLYKECPCPSNYVECSNDNATKGKKCIPLLQSGNYGTPVYSSCECDRSKYKYTCKTDDEQDPYNKGIKAPSGSSANYCEVETSVSNTVVDEETGETNTVTTTEKVKYYTNCECKSDYVYTCTENGQIIPDSWQEDYCQINSTKFYKGCKCSDEYQYTADICKQTEPDGWNIGGTVDVARGYCQPKGKLPSSSENGGDTGTTQQTGTKYYKSCRCKDNFDLTCEESHYIQDDMPYCHTDNGKKYYGQCKCDNTQTKTCSKSGRNQGIIGDDATVCVEKTSLGGGYYDEKRKYTTCACSTGYEIEASVCEGNTEWYNQLNELYCDLSVNAGISGADTNKYYKKCVCDSNVFDTSKILTDTSTIDCSTLYGYGYSVNASFTGTNSFCTEQTSSGGAAIGNSYPHRNYCCQSGLTGYTQIGTQTYESYEAFINSYGRSNLENLIKTNCKHKYNANVELDCSGNAFYKCINSSLANSSDTSWYTDDECSAIDQNGTPLLRTSGQGESITNNWLGEDVIVYPDCSCPTRFNQTEPCNTRRINNLRAELFAGNVDAPVCFDYGRKTINNIYGSIGMTTNMGSCNANPNESKCVDFDGTNKYDYSQCTCNYSHYINKDNDSVIDDCTDPSNGFQWGVTEGCYYQVCIDVTGIYYSEYHQSKWFDGTQPTDAIQCVIDPNNKVQCELKNWS